MKKLLYLLQFIFLGFFIFTFLATCFQVFGDSNPLTKFDNKKPVYNQVEEYDPSLIRLNSVEKLTRYCDSIYLVKNVSAHQEEVKKDYTRTVASVLRKRFYHGYSYDGFSTNYMSLLISKVTVPGWAAIVVPSEILKYPYAACSQQSIVMMEVLQSKGFETRKVGFQGRTSGHFCFEVYYNGSWHFYDTNMEPNPEILDSYDRPGIAYLVSNPDILLKAYNQYPREEILDIFPTYTYGTINQFPAEKAILFQKATKILSYLAWFFFLFLFIIIRVKYLQLSNNQHVRNSGIYFPQSETGTSPSYYPGLTAPGA